MCPDTDHMHRHSVPARRIFDQGACYCCLMRSKPSECPELDPLPWSSRFERGSPASCSEHFVLLGLLFAFASAFSSQIWPPICRSLLTQTLLAHPATVGTPTKPLGTSRCLELPSPHSLGFRYTILWSQLVDGTWLRPCKSAFPVLRALSAAASISPTLLATYQRSNNACLASLYIHKHP